MDELFGDVFQRPGIAPRKRGGFSPAVDVYYADEPPRAVVTAELAGIDADRLGAGDPGPRAGAVRPPPRERGARVASTSRSRSSTAPSAASCSSAPTCAPRRRRRSTRTGCCASSCRSSQPEPRRRSVPIEVPQPGADRAGPAPDDRDRHARRRRARSRSRRSAALPATLPVLPLRDSVTFPETLVPLAVGQERSMALVNDVLGGDRMIALVASRKPELETPGPGGPLRRRRRRASSRGC